MSTLTTIETEAKIHSIPPSAISSYFELSRPVYSQKKKAAKDLVSLWLEGGRVACSTELSNVYLYSKKKDDLADCLAIGVAYLEWSNFAMNFDL